MVAGSSPALGVMSVWRNWIARETSNLKVAGSNPVMDNYIFYVRIPERSKGLDSSSNALCFVGSNPTTYR